MYNLKPIRHKDLKIGKTYFIIHKGILLKGLFLGHRLDTLCLTFAFFYDDKKIKIDIPFDALFAFEKLEEAIVAMIKSLSKPKGVDVNDLVVGNAYYCEGIEYLYRGTDCVEGETYHLFDDTESVHYFTHLKEVYKEAYDSHFESLKNIYRDEP